jgi:hypothetical protein
MQIASRPRFEFDCRWAIRRPTYDGWPRAFPHLGGRVPLNPRRGVGLTPVATRKS